MITSNKQFVEDTDFAEHGSFYTPGEYKVIYAYTIPDSKHHTGLIKIGTLVLLLLTSLLV